MKVLIEQHRETTIDVDPERDLEADHLELYHLHVDRHEITRARSVLESAAMEIFEGMGATQEWDVSWTEASINRSEPLT